MPASELTAQGEEVPEWVTGDLATLIPEVVPASPSLDNNGQSGTQSQSRKPGWSKQQRRIFHRVNSALTYWEAHGYQIRWVMLSSSPDSDARLLAQHHKELLRRVGRKLGFKDVEWFYVITREGFGVIHAFWAWRPGEGQQLRVFWILQRWLSGEWFTIHKASIVWIAAYKNAPHSRKRVSRYVVTQYVAEQDALVRMGWSWHRTFGVPIGRCWRGFKGMHRRVASLGGMRRLVRNWEALMRGEEVHVDGVVYSLAMLRKTRLWARGRA